MLDDVKQFEQINVLASKVNWAWPEAVRNIFRPTGINLLVAADATDFINIIRTKRIHTTILDMDNQEPNGLAMVRIIRMNYPRLPCILLSDRAGKSLLDNALRLDVFSVIEKPVDMKILKEQLNRLFIKKYHINIFGTNLTNNQERNV